MRTLQTALVMGLLLTSANYVSAQDAKAEAKTDVKKEVKTRDLKLNEGKLVLKVPETWKAKRSMSRMRLATLETPAVEGDTEKGELSIFVFKGQDVNANIQRWVAQFQPDGRKQKIMKGKNDKGPYYLVNIEGTFKKSIGPPIQRKTKDCPDYRMLGVILPVKGEGVYFIKLAGPDKSIKAQLKSLRKSFGGVESSEEKHSLSE